MPGRLVQRRGSAAERRNTREAIDDLETREGCSEEGLHLREIPYVGPKLLAKSCAVFSVLPLPPARSRQCHARKSVHRSLLAFHRLPEGKTATDPASGSLAEFRRRSAIGTESRHDLRAIPEDRVEKRLACNSALHSDVKARVERRGRSDIHRHFWHPVTDCAAKTCRSVSGRIMVEQLGDLAQTARSPSKASGTDIAGKLSPRETA